MPDRARSWGFWTRRKLKILADYLDAFTTTASRHVSQRVYLDAFAGEGLGLDRLTGERFEGSARIALAVDSPPFTEFRFFELKSKAERLRRELARDYPDRHIRVYGGDCNETIPQALAELQSLRWAPTFAFLDPAGMQLAWSTLVALAEHKRGYRRSGSAKPEYKTEMWMLFPSQGLIRTLQLKRPPPVEDIARATRLFGEESWRLIHELRLRGELSGREAREEYVNLMRWRLESVLGYQRTHPLEVKNLRGGPLYHMILATDNEAGTRIITDLYGRAAAEIPAMRREIIERLKHPGQLDLGLDTPLPKVLYQYSPPWLPPG